MRRRHLAKKRRLLTRLRHAHRIAARAAVFGPRSRVIQMIAGDRRSPVASRTGDQLKVSIPETFSLVDDAEGAIRLIQDVAAALRSRPDLRNLHIDHSGMKRYDLAANALLDVVIIEFQQQLRMNGLRLRARGAYPEDAGLRRFIDAIGIVAHLKVPRRLTKAEEEKKLKIFDRRVRYYERPTSPKLTEPREQVAAGFVRHIDACLAGRKLQLTTVGVAKLSTCLVEMINNAEEHAQMTDWSLLGYLDSSLEIPICEIAIFNFGRTMAETFQALDKDDYAWKQQQVGEYVELHSAQKLFSQGWREEDLLTVIALQPNISSKNSSSDASRGLGTVDLLNFFNRMHEACTGCEEGAKMTLISGSTNICFDGTYGLKAAEGRRVIAFNEANDLRQRPDSKHVRSLGELRFPGTAISIKFPLVQSMVGEIPNGTHSGN